MSCFRYAEMALGNWYVNKRWSAHVAATVAAAAHSWAKLEKPAKNEIQKIREIDGSYLRLQRFDKFWMGSSSTRKWKLCKFAETCMEKLVKALWVNLFPAGFSHLEPLCNEGRGLTAV